MNFNNTDTDTNLETKDNTPVHSDDEMSQDLKETKDKDKDKDMIYHVNPQGVIDKYPELAGHVEQAYIFCKQCNSWKNLTTQNSIQLQFGEFSFQKQCYIGGFCWTSECNQAQYERNS